MNYESFRGKDMAEALAQVRAAFGPNAIIGMTRVITNGRAGGLGHKFVEVQAAPPSEEALSEPMRPAFASVAALREEQVGVKTATLFGAKDMAKPKTSAADILKAMEGMKAPRHATDDRQPLAGLDAEIRQLRAMIENLTASQKPRDRVNQMLASLGVEGEAARRLADAVDGPIPANPKSARQLLKEIVGDHVAIHAGLLEKPGKRIIACVGPTGAGKTTTLAKLAARATFDLGRSAAVVTLDSFRVGAVEQMRRFSEIMGLPFDVAHDQAGFRAAMKRQEADIVFVDTPSRSTADRRSLERLAECLKAAHGREVDLLLVVPATMRARDAERLLASFDGLDLTGTVITKLDETDQIGGALHPVLTGRLPLSYMSSGPRVPEDLEDATAEGAIAALFATGASLC
jgi:flagellar biosynthesis protein FlhF